MKTQRRNSHELAAPFTGEKLENFGKYILLTNFDNYVHLFASGMAWRLSESTKPMQCATANDITIINFAWQSGAATIMDC